MWSINKIKRMAKKIAMLEGKDQDAGSTEVIAAVIMVAVGIAVYMILGPALVFPGVTSSQTYLANSTQVGNWSQQQVSMGQSTNIFALLAWVLVPVALAVKIL